MCSTIMDSKPSMRFNYCLCGCVRIHCCHMLQHQGFNIYNRGCCENKRAWFEMKLNIYCLWCTECSIVLTLTNLRLCFQHISKNLSADILAICLVQGLDHRPHQGHCHRLKGFPALAVQVDLYRFSRGRLLRESRLSGSRPPKSCCNQNIYLEGHPTLLHLEPEPTLRNKGWIVSSLYQRNCYLVDLCRLWNPQKWPQ